MFWRKAKQDTVGFSGKLSMQVRRAKKVGLWQKLVDFLRSLKSL